MKAWRFFVLIGGCLLLADISTVLTLTPALVKEKSALQTATFTADLHSDAADKPNGKCYFFPSTGLKIFGTRQVRDTD